VILIAEEYSQLISGIWTRRASESALAKTSWSHERKRQYYLGIPENRESATSIEAVSAAGGYIPAFVILSGQRQMARWY